MANIENKDKTPQENQGKVKETLQKTKEKVQKLSWWAKLFLFCFFFFIFSIFSVLVLINTPWGQNRIAKFAIDEFVNKGFGTTFETENVKINFLGDVVISGVRAKDHHGFEFLRAEKLIGHSDWFSIITNSRDLKFNKLSLEGLDLKVITYKGEDQDNFTKFIEKFDDDKPLDPKKAPFRFTSRIQIINSKVSIVNRNQGNDGKWLEAKDFNALVSELKVVGSDIKLKLNKMSFITERWGKKHYLEALSSDVLVSKEKFELKDLLLHTDHSLLQGDLTFKLDKKTGWQDFNDKVVWDMNLKKGSYINGYDISYFVKDWDNSNRYYASGKMYGALNSFMLKDFWVKINNNELKTPEIHFNNLLEGNFRIKSNDIHANIVYKDIRNSMPKFIANKMGNFADDFGNIKYKGFVNINKNEVIARGDLHTSIGSAKINNFVLKNYSSQMPEYVGDVLVNNLDTKVITKDDTVGYVSGNFNIRGRGFDINTLSLDSKSYITSIDIMNKKLKNINIDGNLTKKQFNGIIKINDTEARGIVNGKIDFSSPKLYADIKADVEHFNLNYFGGESKDSSIFRGSIDGKISMTNINDLMLDANISNIEIINNERINIPNGAVKITMEEGNRVIDVNLPDAIEGRVSGKFNLGDIGEIFKESANRILVGNPIKKYYKGQSFDIDITINQKLIDYFEPNIHIGDEARIVGNFDGNTSNIKLDVEANSIKYIMKKEISEADRLLAYANPDYKIRENIVKDSVVLDNVAINVNTFNPENYWSVKAGRAEYQKSVLKDISINAKNIDNKRLDIATNLQVGTLEKEKNNQMKPYQANIEQSVNSDGDYVVKFSPTELKLSKFIWMVDTSPELNHSITYRKKNNDFIINNLKLYSDNSEILVNGIFKNSKDFNLSGDVKNMELSKVMAIVHQDSNIDIKGIANGSLKVKMNKSNLEPLIDLKIDNIFINDTELGSMVINAENSNSPNVYNVDAKIISDEWFGSDKFAMKGIIDNNTKSPKLDLTASFNNFDLKFVQAFVKDIFSNFRGKATGDINIDGYLNDINYGGDVEMKNMGLTLKFSGVDYNFDDTIVTVANGNLLFNLVGVKDSRKNSKGMISIGRLSLADLSNIGADLLIRADNLQLLNTEQKDFDVFWGMIYGKGDIFVGFENQVLKVDATAEVLDNSIFTLNSASVTSGDEFKMLRFIEKDEKGNIAIADKKQSGLAMDINLDITADKNSTVNVLLGEEVGNISVQGNTKNMKFMMDKTGNMNIFGGYSVESGQYISKAILEKEFQIKKGSSLQWSGNVMNPELNIMATYDAVVSNMGEYLSVGSLPAVNLELQTKITNRLTKPNVEPSIFAPDISSQIREVLNSKLSTEEERVLQFASILVLGNFNVSNTNASSAIGSGVNIFFNQLSSAFNSISKDFQVDLDYIKGSESQNTGDRASAKLSYQLSKRLVIKGGTGIPLASSSRTQNNYLSGEGIVEYDWSDKNDGSRIFRMYSKPANVGLVAGSSAGANQTYGGGVVFSYGFNRIIPRRRPQENTKKDTISKDSLKID